MLLLMSQYSTQIGKLINKCCIKIPNKYNAMSPTDVFAILSRRHKNYSGNIIRPLKVLLITSTDKATPNFSTSIKVLSLAIMEYRGTNYVWMERHQSLH